MEDHINPKATKVNDGDILPEPEPGISTPSALELPAEQINPDVPALGENNDKPDDKAGNGHIKEHDEILNSLLNELRPVDFYEKAELSQGEKLSKKHYLVISVEEMLQVATKNKWSLRISDGFVYCYNGAFWKPLSKEEVQTFLGRAALKLGVDKFEAEFFQFKNDLYSQFLSYAQLSRPEKKKDEVLINLQNGTFVIRTKEQFIKAFERSDFLTYQLPFPYSPQQRTTLFQAYLNRVLPDVSQQKILAEYIGYLFVKQKVLKLEKALILYGGGANGKSVFFEITTALLGPDNVSSYSLQSLTDKTGYFRAQIKNKLCNYASEISTHMDSTLFKQMVSGEAVEARLPYQNPITMVDYAKLIFNTNELPKDVEQTEAFFRRFLILKFDVTIPAHERDPQLANKIIANELPGVFNWVLEGLQRLLAQKSFTPSVAVKKMVEQYQKESDTVHLFLDDNNYITSVDKEIPLKSMFTEYKDYCRDSNYQACTLKVFGERLRRLKYSLRRKNTGNFVSAEKKVYN